MVAKSFYLLGKDASISENVHLVDIDITHDFKTAQSHVADAFSIVDPTGVGFQTRDMKCITDLDALLDAEQPVAVTIDGNPVRKVPGPKGLPVVGSYYQVYPDHIGNHQRLFERIGPVIQHTDMGRTQYFTNDPAVASHVFQESPFWSKVIGDSHPLFGVRSNKSGLFICDTDTESWRLAHKFFPPALSPKAVRKYTPSMQHTAESTFKVFDGFAAQNEAFDVFSYMFKLTSQAVAKLILNVNLNHFESPDTPLDSLVTDLSDFLTLVKKVSEKGSWYSHLPFGEPQKLRNIQGKFFEECKRGLEQARARGGEDLPIATAALEADSIADYLVRAVDENGKKLPDDVAVETFPILIGAGFTTTASLMSWMIYTMVTYPEVQQKLLQELVNHGVTADTKWTFDTTNDLPYLDKFIKETQRLYNPAFQPARTALRDQIIPGGYEIPKDATMICSIHAIHRNPAQWDDPNKFDPDRWDTDKVRNRPNAAFAPFAQGPRSCIGFNFALQEAKTIMATLLYRYEFVKYGDAGVDYDPEFIVYRPMNLFARIQRRSQWPEKSK